MIDLGFYLNGPSSYAHVAWGKSIAAVAGAGFTAIDVSASAGVRGALDSSTFPGPDRDRLRAIADEHGLTVSAVVTHAGLADTIQQGRPLDLEAAVDVAVDLRCPLVLVHIGGPATLPWRAADLWESAVAHVRRACDHGADRGVRVALDAVAPDFLTPTPADVRRFLEDVGRANVGWNFDPAYLALNGFGLEETVDLLGRWSCHAHIKDYRAADTPPWLIPGDGEMDHRPWAAALLGLDRPVVAAAEVIARPRDLPERWSLADACERSITTLRAALEAAGRASRPGPGSGR